MNKALLIFMAIASMGAEAHWTEEDRAVVLQRERDQYRKIVNLQTRVEVLEAEMDALLRPARLEALQRAREKREVQK